MTSPFGAVCPQQIPRTKRIAWATLLRRVFDANALACPTCLTPMVVLAFITDPTALAHILDHLGLPTAPPALAPARLPAEDDVQFPDDDPTDDLTSGVSVACARTRRPPPAPS